MLWTAGKAHELGAGAGGVRKEACRVSPQSKGTPWRASGEGGMLSLGLQDASSSCWAGKGMEGPPEGAH